MPGGICSEFYPYRKIDPVILKCAPLSNIKHNSIIPYDKYCFRNIIKNSVKLWRLYQMKRKLLCIFLVLVLMAGFAAGCGSDKDKAPTPIPAVPVPPGSIDGSSPEATAEPTPVGAMEDGAEQEPITQDDTAQEHIAPDDTEDE
jgi:hypothetical protein